MNERKKARIEAVRRAEIRKRNRSLVHRRMAFIRADLQLSVFRLVADGEPDAPTFGALPFEQPEYQSRRRISALILWLATLAVTVEKWKEAGFGDAVLDEMLADPRARRLWDFRNAVLHPNAFEDTRVVDLIRDGEETLPWYGRVHEELGRFFEERLGYLAPVTAGQTQPDEPIGPQRGA